MLNVGLIVAAILAAGPSALQPPAGPARPDAGPVREAMKRLEPWVGEWTGTAWYEGGGGRPRTETSMVERIQWKLGGSALLVEGTGRSKGPGGEEIVVHNALAVVSYDAEAGRYRFNHWRESGEHGESEIRFEGDAMVWENPTPRGTARFTVHINDGRWHEVGEASGDGGQTWFKFMEMKLERKGP